jgi:two-component system phosphate regulon sensor histidine kinase PhoR
MNDAAARMLDLDAALDTGETLWQRLRFADLERGLRASLETGEPWHADANSPRDDGRTLSISVAPVRGESSGAVALLSDVTEIRRLEQVRRDFVANVSHEMRTPLSAVLGALETLADEGQDEASRKRFLDIAQRNAVRLQAIVADLLDLSTIEARGESMTLEPVRIDEPLRSAAAALSGAAQKKGVELACPAASASFPVVQGNRQRLEQAFTNLIANAIHYTPGGGQVRARVRATPREVAVEVEDNGIGIPAASLPRVFERFFRVDRGRSRDTGGTGLGLAIVKHIALAHGGKVEVRSEEGRGSTFTILFPSASARS